MSLPGCDSSSLYFWSPVTLRLFGWGDVRMFHSRLTWLLDLMTHGHVSHVAERRMSQHCGLLLRLCSCKHVNLHWRQTRKSRYLSVCPLKRHFPTPAMCVCVCAFVFFSRDFDSGRFMLDPVPPLFVPRARASFVRACACQPAAVSPAATAVWIHLHRRMPHHDWGYCVSTGVGHYNERELPDMREHSFGWINTRRCLSRVESMLTEVKLR